MSAVSSALPLPALRLDAEAFEKHFARQPFRIQHQLIGDPRLELARVEALAASFPADRVEANANRSWIAIKNIENDPDYADLLNRCLDEIGTFTEPIEPGMRAREGFLFVSRPFAVTPYHMDPEHNFLLQIRGSKRIHLFDGADRGILSEEELEKFYTGGGRNLVWSDSYGAKARPFELVPGDGLYFPVTHPHHVRNGGDLSISLSVTFRTQAIDDRDRLYKVNRRLRDRGIAPAPIGASPARDRVILGALDAARWIKRRLVH